MRTTLKRQKAYLHLNLTKTDPQEPLNEAEDCCLKNETHAVIQSFLNRAYSLKLAAISKEKIFLQELAENPHTSYTNYLLASLPLCITIFSETPYDQIKNLRDEFIHFGNTLLKNLIKNWKSQHKVGKGKHDHKQEATDCFACFERIISFSVTQTYRVRAEIENPTVEMNTAIQYYLNLHLSKYESIAAHIQSFSEQPLFLENLYLQFYQSQEVAKMMSTICKPQLDGLKKTFEELQKIVEPIIENENQTISQAFEGLNNKLTDALRRIQLLNDKDYEEGTPWEAFSQSLFSHLTFAMKDAIDTIIQENPDLGEVLQASILAIYKTNKTLNMMCCIYQSALEKFLSSIKQDNGESKDTPEIFKHHLACLGRKCEERDAYGIYFSTIKFSTDLEDLLKSLGLNPPSKDNQDLSLRQYLNELVECSATLTNQTSSNAKSASLFGSRSASPVPETASAPAPGGGAGK